MVIYQVIHKYDEEVSVGEYVESDEIVETFENYDDAMAFVRTFSNPQWSLGGSSFGTLRIRDREIISHDGFDISQFNPRNYWWTKESQEELRIERIRTSWATFSFMGIDLGKKITEDLYIFGSEPQFKSGTQVSEIKRWFEENYPGGVKALRDYWDANDPNYR